MEIAKKLHTTRIRMFSFYIPEGKNPEIYHDTRAKLQLAPEECLIVEDSSYGIQAGKAAGMEVVAIKDTQFSFDQSAADYFIDKTTDLINLLPLI